MDTIQTCRYCGCTHNAASYIGIKGWPSYEHDACFGCNFWLMHLHDDAAGDKAVFAVVKGSHYLIGDEPVKGQHSRMLGFGGSEFRIRFNDGRYIVSHNLWHQGKIPDHWLAQFPDNAVFEGGF